MQELTAHRLPNPDNPLQDGSLKMPRVIFMGLTDEPTDIVLETEYIIDASDFNGDAIH